MTAIAIMPLHIEGNAVTFHAVAGNKESYGKTAGQALDALTAQLGQQDANTLIIVQNLRPDAFFTDKQQNRLSMLMGRWRAARDQGQTLSISEQAELDKLVLEEVQASEARTRAILQDISR